MSDNEKSVEKKIIKNKDTEKRGWFYCARTHGARFLIPIGT